MAAPFIYTISQDSNEGADPSTSRLRNQAEESTADDNFKAKVAQLERMLEYPIRMFNETTRQIALCFKIAAQCHPYPQNLDAKTASMHTLTASLTHRVSGPALGATFIRANNAELDDLFTALDTEVDAMKSSKVLRGDRKAMKLLGLVREMTRARRFFVTADRYMGLAPGEAREGDRVAVVYGCSTPVLIRGIGDGEAEWRLVGECYVYGLMDGEAVTMDGIPVRDIQLV